MSETTNIENSAEKKIDFRLLLLIILSIISGSLCTYIVVDYVREKEIQDKIKSDEYKNLSNILIEIEGGITAGINQVEWSTRMRELSIASNKYKVSTDVDEEEISVLETILNDMRKTSDIWKLDLNYNCRGKIPTDECIKEYAAGIYKLHPDIKATQEEYTSSLIKKIRSEGLLLEDHQNELVSLNLSLTSWSISNFFDLHGIKL